MADKPDGAAPAAGAEHSDEGAQQRTDRGAQQHADEVADRIRDMTERLIASSKGTGLAALDAYEKALASMLRFQEKSAGATQIDWIAEFAAMQAKYVKSVSKAVVSASRNLLR